MTSSALHNIKRVSILLFSLLLFLCTHAQSSEEPVTYSTLFDADYVKEYKSLWKIYKDEDQDLSKLIKKRKIRAVFVGRYDAFKKQFERDSYSRLSVYRSPFQIKVLFINEYFSKLIRAKHFTKDDKLYLKIKNHKQDYFNLYPHIYKKAPTSKKVSIIPNKLFQVSFFDDDRYIEPYQELFDAVTKTVTIDDVKVDNLFPLLLDETSKLKLREKDTFYFYKVSATVNEVAMKKALDSFFIDMKDIADVISVTEFYKTIYMPKIGDDFTPVSERTIITNVLYDPDSDFDYHQMEYSKKGALIHEYFFREGLSTHRDSPRAAGGGVNLTELQKVYDTTMYPDVYLFEFEYDSDRDDYNELIEDFYDDLDDAMYITEEVLAADELDLEVLKLTATVDEVMLANLINELKEELKEYEKGKKGDDDEW